MEGQSLMEKNFVIRPAWPLPPPVNTMTQSSETASWDSRRAITFQKPHVSCAKDDKEDMSIYESDERQVITSRPVLGISRGGYHPFIIFMDCSYFRNSVHNK